MTLAQRWNALLADLRAAGRQRTLELPSGIDLVSNDYLAYGGSRQPRLDPALAGLPRSGLASRLLRGHHPLWEQVEDTLARWHGADSALVFSSGYTANEGLLAAILEPGDWVASDACNHASIIDGLRLARAERFVFRHNDLEHLEDGVRVARRTARAGSQRFIVSESLFSMDGDRAPLTELVSLARRYDAWLILDEAHATGCFGASGSGLVDTADARADVLATIHTGGKALGVAGAYVCGPALLREVLINRCRPFIFTTALPPVVAAWWLAALAQVKDDSAGRASLHSAALLFRQELAQQGIVAGGEDYIVPIVLGGDARASAIANRLQAGGWDVRAIRPPTVPPGTARLRLAIHADHPPEVLRSAAAAVAEAIRECGEEAV
jgi:8-amino-7-oxononanoate synthase